MNTTRRFASLCLCASLLVVSACSKPAPAPEPIRAVRVQTVTEQAIGGVSEFAGEVQARTESRLGFRVGGKVLRRLVNVGDAVAAGQVLAQLDPQDLRLGRDAGVAAVAAAKASYEQALADSQRDKELRAQGFISSADNGRRETAVKSARAQLDQAVAQSRVQENQAGYTTLVADAPGVVTGVDVEPGVVVSAGTPVVRIARDGPRDVVFAIPEDKASLVQALATQTGRFNVRLWAGRTDAQLLPATIREIAAAADPVTRTFQVKADIGTAAHSGVRLGQTATVLMDIPGTKGVTKLPLSALREEQGKTTVWLVDKASMTVSAQAVQVAGANENDAVITSGLTPGQTVVTAGVHVLSSGQKVKFYAEAKAAAESRTASGPASSPVASK